MFRVDPTGNDTGAHVNEALPGIPEGGGKPLKNPLIFRISDVFPPIKTLENLYRWMGRLIIGSLVDRGVPPRTFVVFHPFGHFFLGSL